VKFYNSSRLIQSIVVFRRRIRGPKGYQATIDGVREPHVSQDVFAPRIVGISGLGSCN